MASVSKGSASLSLPNGKTYELPVIQGTEHQTAIDVGKLRLETGYVCFDPSFASTASCESAITYVNGEEGILRYRGYPIEELAVHSSFVETSYLLIYGELPSKKQLEKFDKDLTYHTLIHEDLKRFFDGFPRDAHPMAILSAAVAALYTYYQDWDDPRDPEQQDLGIIRLLAKLPTLAAFSYKKSIGQYFIYPDNTLNYSENFLRMMYATPAEKYEVDPDVAAALDLLLILHADHEQNCSTSTVRTVGSSLSNLFSSISAGIGALWGPLHGGANQRVIEMLNTMVADGGKLQKYIDMAKDKDNDFRLMGFGHRLYKNYDPRAKILRDSCHKLLNKLGIHDELFDLALELENVALKDDYFVEKKLYPNVDFYSGIIYHALGIPVKSFTAMFALGRLPGWIAQWRELVSDPKMRISRPRQVYIGEKQRPYVRAWRRK